MKREEEEGGQRQRRVGQSRRGVKQESRAGVGREGLRSRTES